MKVLIAPMAVIMETGGPALRAAQLARCLLDAGHTPAFCAALDGNYREVPSVPNYACPIPSPFGLPMFLGRGMSRFATAIGAPQRQTVHSFEQVLFFSGALNRKYFERDVAALRQAIQAFKPDIVYAEFRLTAIVAAKLENVPVATGYSFPVRAEFASNPNFSKDVRNYIAECGMPRTESVLELFGWADLKIVPSSPALEPMDGTDIVFTGPFIPPALQTGNAERSNIIAYVGMGTLPPKLLVETLTQAFRSTLYSVYIASAQIKPHTDGNIIVGRRFDFSALMPNAAVYINHGGQNSIMTGLLSGVPQIVCPGRVFERKYNAQSVVSLCAGIQMEAENFTADALAAALQEFEQNGSWAQNANKAGDDLLALGGVKTAVRALEKLIGYKQ